MQGSTKQTKKEVTHCDDYRGAPHNLACLALLVNLTELQHNFTSALGSLNDDIQTKGWSVVCMSTYPCPLTKLLGLWH